MTVEEIRDICLSLKEVKESIKWENHLCFTVRDKMFFVINPDNIIPAPYLAKHNWVHYDSIDRFATNQWKKHIQTAYSLVFDKLPARTKK